MQNTDKIIQWVFSYNLVLQGGRCSAAPQAQAVALGPQGFGKRWKVVLLIHTISQIWWSLLETKLTDTLGGLNRQRQTVPRGESQRESFCKSFFLIFFLFIFFKEGETVQSENQHILLTKPFLVYIHNC